MRIFIIFFFAVMIPAIAKAELILYDFEVNTKSIKINSGSIEAFAINNQIPAPIIKATVGDTLRITVTNKLPVPTSIHWHGVLLPNNQDGVPFLTTPQIEPNSSFTYQYDVTHSGTYWYHSHSGLQEQQGLYGAMVFYPKEKNTIDYDVEHIVVLSDWINEKPEKVLANIKKDGDYYALKKDSVQSWDKVLLHGKEAIKNRLQGSWSRMGTMDISDVGYDAFLINGKQVSSFESSPNIKVLLRLVNASASTYFNVELAENNMKIVSADGVNVQPTDVKRLRIATAETYDVIVEIPENKSYELRATSTDGTGFASLFIGQGEKVQAPNIPKPNPFITNHDDHSAHKETANTPKDPHTHHQHHMHHKQELELINYMDNYDNLRSLTDTSFDNANVRNITLNLTGNMERYIWTFNNKTLLESDKITIRKGEIIRVKLNNETMMHHPIHLHGHFFRVINKHGNYSPLKHTVDVPPMGEVTIEFEANEEKDWFFHCHNLYHMKNGMARVFSYEGSSAFNEEIKNKIAHDDWYHKGNITTLSNMTFGAYRISNARNAFEVEYDYNYEKEYDVDIIYERSLTRFLELFMGLNLERDNPHKKAENTGVIGFKYVLPMLLESKFQLNSEKDFEFSIGSELQLTDRTKFLWQYTTDKDFDLRLLYEINKSIQFIGTYDSHFKWGLGLQFNF